MAVFHHYKQVVGKHKVLTSERQEVAVEML
jgi:hypothetical protein